MKQRIQQPIPITRPYMPPKDEFMNYANSLWETRHLTRNGPLVNELQEQLKERLQVPNLIVFANGHLALDCALKALNLQDGEAITTPFTYLSTANALAMNSLTPVFCDIKEDDCTIDERKIESLITSKTKVIVPVHVYGFPCNWACIQEIADKYNLKVVYDAAHAFGVTVEGRGIGTFGDASMFSFQATKVYHTVEGGAISYQNKELTEKLIAAKNFGLVEAEEADSISLNAKMSELHAAMGLANLKTINDQIARRKELIEHYLESLSKVNGIRLFHWDTPGINYNYAYFPIIFEPDILGISRDEIARRLEQEYRVLVRKYFYPLLSDLHCYPQQDSNTTPIAQKIASSVLTLPLFTEMTHEQVDFVCDSLKEILKRDGDRT